MTRRNLDITLIGLENAHGLVLRVVNGELQIDASSLPKHQQQQAHFDADPAEFEPHPTPPGYVSLKRARDAHALLVNGVKFRSLQLGDGEPVAFAASIAKDVLGSHYVSVSHPQGFDIPLEIDGVPIRIEEAEVKDPEVKYDYDYWFKRGTLPTLATDLHGHITGSAELYSQEQLDSLVQYLDQRVSEWESNDSGFDLAVLNMVSKALSEWEDFANHLTERGTEAP